MEPKPVTITLAEFELAIQEGVNAAMEERAVSTTTEPTFAPNFAIMPEPIIMGIYLAEP